MAVCCRVIFEHFLCFHVRITCVSSATLGMLPSRAVGGVGGGVLTFLDVLIGHLLRYWSFLVPALLCYVCCLGVG